MSNETGASSKLSNHLYPLWSLIIADQLGRDRDDIIFTLDGNEPVDSRRGAHQLYRIGVLVHGIGLAVLGLVV